MADDALYQEKYKLEQMLLCADKFDFQAILKQSQKVDKLIIEITKKMIKKGSTDHSGAVYTHQ